MAVQFMAVLFQFRFGFRQELGLKMLRLAMLGRTRI